MDSIQIKDKQFTVSIKEQDIQKEVIRVANEINRDLADKNPLFLSVLNGSFMFTADLLKHNPLRNIVCQAGFLSGSDFHRSYQRSNRTERGHCRTYGCYRRRYCRHGADYAATARNIGYA